VAEAGELEIRPPTPADLPALGALYVAVKGRPRPEPATRQRFFDTPWGDSVALAAFDGELCVCVVDFWPVAICVGDEVVSGAQGMDAVTHPGYRNRPRLFLRMARTGRDLTTERGIELLYTFPNTRSMKLTKHVGATYLGEVGSWGVELASRRFRLPRRARRTAVEVGEPAAAELAALVSAAHADKSVVRIDKSAAWLGWRYSELACERFDWLTVRDAAGALTAAALLGERRSADWGDDFAGIVRIHELFALDEAAARAVLEGAVEHVRRGGGRKLDILVKEPVVERVVELAGFVREAGYPMTTLSHGTRDVAVDTHDFSRWRITSGDHDFF
jgi:Acetyltransferase (GNAT) domain